MAGLGGSPCTRKVFRLLFCQKNPSARTLTLRQPTSHICSLIPKTHTHVQISSIKGKISRPPPLPPFFCKPSNLTQPTPLPENILAIVLSYNSDQLSKTNLFQELWSEAARLLGVCGWVCGLKCALGMEEGGKGEGGLLTPSLRSPINPARTIILCRFS